MTEPKSGVSVCTHCGQTIIVDVARDTVSHEEPVCPAFESAMRRASGNRGRAEVFDPRVAKLVPDPRARPRPPGEPWGRS